MCKCSASVSLFSVALCKVLGPNFRNFLGRSLEDFFSKESMQIFETLWKLLRKNLGKYVGKH